MKGINHFVNIFLVALITLSSCEKTTTVNENPYASQQEEMLTNIGNNLILPALADLETSSQALYDQSNVFANDLSLSNLSLLKEKWRAAYLHWQSAAFYMFGPSESYGMIGLNIYPANTTTINDYITSGIYDLNTAGATLAKGFPALDYMLYGYAASDEELIISLTNNANAVQYIVDVSNNLYTTVQSVNNGWKVDQGNFIATFTNNLGTSSGGGISQLVNGWSKYLESHLRNAKVGTPNGNSVVTTERFGPFPEKCEAYYSRDLTLDLLKASLDATLNFYMGIDKNNSDDVGIYDYLKTINAQNGTLADDFKVRIETAITETNQLNGTFVEAINTQGTEVTDVFNELKAIIALLKVDIVSAMSISITYADNDGD